MFLIKLEKVIKINLSNWNLVREKMYETNYSNYVWKHNKTKRIVFVTLDGGHWSVRTIKPSLEYQSIGVFKNKKQAITRARSFVKTHLNG